MQTETSRGAAQITHVEAGVLTPAGLDVNGMSAIGDQAGCLSDSCPMCRCLCSHGCRGVDSGLPKLSSESSRIQRV